MFDLLTNQFMQIKQVLSYKKDQQGRNIAHPMWVKFPSPKTRCEKIAPQERATRLI